MVNICGLVDPRNNNIFYVGASTTGAPNIRSRHKNVALNSFIEKGCRGDVWRRYTLIKELTSLGIDFKVRLLETCEQDKAKEREREVYYEIKAKGHDLMQFEGAFGYSHKNKGFENE